VQKGNRVQIPRKGGLRRMPDDATEVNEDGDIDIPGRLDA
jgi:hypothetical protein